MANLHGILALTATIDGQIVPSDSRYTYAGDGRVLTVHTTVPGHPPGFELISTYTGSDGLDTHITHLRLGPKVPLGGAFRAVFHRECDGDELRPDRHARGCVYDHARTLIDELRSLGHSAAVALDDHTFTALEAVE
jgi:hypothetical protein